MDGKVDAFGVGGVEFYLRVGKKKYYFKDVSRVRRAIKVSKVGDGNGVKGLLERRAFQALEKHLNEKENKTLKGMPALLTTAVDRYGMGEAMVDAGLDLTIGDLMFALGLPFPREETFHGTCDCGDVTACDHATAFYLVLCPRR
jgi:hypothetical protein